MMKLDYRSMSGEVFCDFFSLTFPPSVLDSLKADLSEVFDVCGLAPNDIFPDQYQALSVPGNFHIGTCKRSKLARVSVTGSVCSHIRQHRQWDRLISIFLHYDYHVTRIDATADFHVYDVPQHVQDLKSRVLAHGAQLTRKALLPSQCSAFIRSTVLPPYRDTGTVYIGEKGKQEVICKVYDKQNERLDKGLSDCGSLLRVEFTISTRVTLRDIHNPRNIFFHYAAQSLVVPPPDFTGWEPDDSGFDVPKQADLFTPAGKIYNLLKYSYVLSKIQRMAIAEWGDMALYESRILFDRAWHSLLASKT